MKRTWISILVGMMLVAAAACGDAAQRDAARTDAAPRSPAEQTYAPDLGVNLQQMNQTPSGLYVQNIAEGTGQTARAGNIVEVHYTGWLPNGREFDSSRDGEPFEFVLGQGMVIPGWDEGVEGMREGGRRRLVIPSELAYGAQGAGGVIPPHATLVFDVELLRVQ
jgi:FKBP-type peptidyl-prolyl cis-trans isomerase FkpA